MLSERRQIQKNIYIKCPEKIILGRQKIVVAQGWRWEREGLYINGYEVSFFSDGNVLEFECDDACLIL